MRVYEVEMRRISYIYVTVEAESDHAAREQAHRKIETTTLDLNYGWEVESVEELGESE